VADKAVRVRGLSKTYRVPVREAGLRAALRSLIRRRTRSVEAVCGIDFEIDSGEIVGFLGPNGAGKTTTLKMLSGLLHPSAGEVAVLEHVPARRERAFLERITLVMGQRNQLVWNIPVIDSFERNRAIYRVAAPVYQKTIAELTELLDLGDLWQKPSRNLSLGERMKCEVALALLHRPQVLFLDEPTIGLDVTMQRRVREFIREHNRRSGATVLLTSHYMADVEALCPRVIVIDKGHILFDGAREALVERFSTHKTIVLDLDDAGFDVDVSRYGELVRRDGARLTLRVPRADAPRVTAQLLADLPVRDLAVENPGIEDVIERVFREERA
jgi:ABC-2 type transport system ATP-binding protein